MSTMRLFEQGRPLVLYLRPLLETRSKREECAPPASVTGQHSVSLVPTGRGTPDHPASWDTSARPWVPRSCVYEKTHSSSIPVLWTGGKARELSQTPLTGIGNAGDRAHDMLFFSIRAYLSWGLALIWNGMLTSRTGWSIPPGCEGASRPSVSK